MIGHCYLDSSALVKCYAQELGSDELRKALINAEVTGTVAISRVEVTSALARGIRLGFLPQEEGEAARQFFGTEWKTYFQIGVTQLLLERSCDVAWLYGLKGYDAVQLAAATSWQESLGVPLTMATFDVQLWNAAARARLDRYPPDLPALLDSWKDAALR